MKLGLSTYSLVRAINSGEMDVLDVIDWIAENGGQHVEIVPFGFDLFNNEVLSEKIKDKAEERGLEISNYAISSNLTMENDDEYKRELERLKEEVEIAHKLGVKIMRFDVAGFEHNTIVKFKEDLPQIVKGCQKIADYAAQYDITITVENHGFYMNGTDRVQWLINEVDRNNYKLTMDIGNFWCVDESPETAVKKNLDYAAMIHLKDFYFRKARGNFVYENWIKTVAGNYLRGAIVGEGDIDMWQVLKTIKESSYDGYLSIEFEGMEECKLGSKRGLGNVRKIWNEL